jgi:hypothetical protein
MNKDIQKIIRSLELAYAKLEKVEDTVNHLGDRAENHLFEAFGYVTDAINELKKLGGGA